MKDFLPLAAVTCSCLIDAAAMPDPALLEGLSGRIGGIHLGDWIGILCPGFFGALLGFSWHCEGIREIGPSRALLFINFVPVNGLFFGWLVLDEAVNLSLLAGAPRVITGIYRTNRPR